MSSRSDILTRQRSWALATGQIADRRGYLATVEANLLQPMCETSRAAFEKGSGSELKTKMRALHSSSALAVNFFEYWVAADRTPLANSLDLHIPIESISFETQYYTSLPGKPPNLDICLSLSNGHTIAVESKFCEWLGRKSGDKEYFKTKYFAGGDKLWTARGLPMCQTLAEDMRDHREHFAYLDVPQLLKHALGLATQVDQRFDLYYIYFDCQGSESGAHKAEIDRFSKRVGMELRFKSFTYQDLLRRLDGQDPESHYINYLRQRYF